MRSLVSMTRHQLLHRLIYPLALLVPTTLMPLSPVPLNPAHAFDATTTDPAADLLRLIPAMPFGAPATRRTIPLDVAEEIEAQVVALERQAACRHLAEDPSLSGTWLLRYTNSPEITNLAEGLPLGFALGRTYQPIDISRGYFENQGAIEHVLGLARASTCVVGDVSVAPANTRNAAGTLDVAGNRVFVDFRRIVFSIDELLGQKMSGLRKVVVPRNDPNAARPSNDITYLSAGVRLTRGGDDSIFVFTREAVERPLLSVDERERLFSEGGAGATTGLGVAEKSAPPEFRKLLGRRQDTVGHDISGRRTN
ncbi:hypothetical protein AB1Y20_003234 [Prymnesium parvum]|uniref:Plastid lipid-associated protein/fibrillin conserved domain-containing protein n=1 Tax=Prymnesium parvum TaxID=97485 RepID=A0AB34JE88_PRYPA